MREYFKVYNVQFGACSVIRGLLPYYSHHILDNRFEYFSFFANSEALVVDGGTSSNNSNLLKSYASKVAKDIYYYGKVNFLISHFHQDHTNFIANIFEEIGRRRNKIVLPRYISIKNNYIPTIYIYSPFNYENELYLSILSLAYRLACREKLSDGEYYVLLQFTLTSNLRDLIYKRKLKIKLLNNDSTFEVNYFTYYVLKKDHSDKLSIFNQIADVNLRELLNSLKSIINNDRNLRYLNLMCHAYDRYFRNIVEHINPDNENDDENYYNYLSYLGEARSYLVESSEIEVLKSEIEYLSKIINIPNDPSFKRILSSNHFDKHRYNLAFYSKHGRFIYFGDNSCKDTTYGLEEILGDNKGIFFNVACANHHGTSYYAKPFTKFNDLITFGTLFCSNGTGNSNYGKVDYNTYSKFCRSIYLTNERISGTINNDLCPVYFTNDNSYGMRFY